MIKDIRVHLDDILFSSSCIEKYIRGMSKEDFEKNEEVQDAVMCRLEVIGEAVKRLPLEFRSNILK